MADQITYLFTLVKRLNSFAETFIKKSVSVKGKKVVASALTFVSLSGFSGVISTEAYAPTSAEAASSTEEVAEVNTDRAAAMQKLAAELNALAADKEDILWLARVVYSETKLESEMPLIAWVIRNRVETKHRSYDPAAGKSTYKGAALAKNQFSGMWPALDRHAYRNLAMSYQTTGDPAWSAALRVAEEVYYSDGSDRPFSSDVLHFYSPVAIAPPAWAYTGTKVHETPGQRFAFYAYVR